MLKKLIFASVLLISIASCKSKSAFNYSQEIVKKEKSLIPDITTTEDKVKHYFEDEHFDSIAVVGEKMEQLVESKIQEIKTMPLPDAKEADNFKEACLKYFGFIKSIYSGYKEWGLAPADERQGVMDKIIAMAGNRQASMDAMQTAQKKFADANGFKIEN